MRKPRKGLYLILAFALFLNLLMPPLAIANEGPGTSSNACVETIVEEVDGQEAAPSTTDEAEPSATTEENGAAVVADEEAAASVDVDDSIAENEGNVEETTPSDEAENPDTTDGVTEETPQPCEEEVDKQLAKPLNGLMAAGNVINENIITDVRIWDEQPIYDDQNNIINNPTDIQLTRPDIGAEVVIHVEWELDNETKGYKDGDTYTFQLPDNFKVRAEETGSLVGSPSVGEYRVYTENGKTFVTFTFNEKIEGQLVKGDFFVGREFKELGENDSLKQTVEFEGTAKGDIPITVHFKHEGKSTSKIGKAYKNNQENNRNPEEVRWVVDFNKGEQKMKLTGISDPLPQGHTLMGNIEVYTIDITGNGSGINESPQPEAVFTNFPITETQLTALGDSGTITSAYRLKYTTAITAPTGPYDNYEPNYSNTITVTGKDPNNDPIREPASTIVGVKFNKPLTKTFPSSGSYTGNGKTYSRYIATTQTVSWAVQYNYNQKQIDKDDAWITDTFDENHKFVEGSMQVFKMNIDPTTGVASKQSTTPLVEGTHYSLEVLDSADVPDPNGTKFKLSFLDPSGINSAYEIVYQTTSRDRVYGDTVNVSNSVVSGSEATASDSYGTGQVVFKKHRGTVNYDKKTVAWQIVLNEDNETMTNVVITDKFTVQPSGASQGLKLKQDSFKINGTLIADLHPSDYKLVVTPNSTDADYDDQFVLTFENPINDKIEITYETEFDPTYFGPGGEKTTDYVNTAKLDWDEDPTASTTKVGITKTATFTPNSYMKKNGNKTAVYDAENKLITWTVDINYNRHEIENAVFEDYFTDTQEFLKGTLKIYPLTIASNGNVSVAGSEFMNYRLEDGLKNDKEYDGFKIIFKEINSPYQITYQTRLKGLPVLAKYENKATLTGKDKPKLFDETYTLTNPELKYGGEYVSKEVKQGDGVTQSERYADWTVNINRSQSFVEKGSVLTDVLSPNQVLQLDTIKLYSTTVTDHTGSLAQSNEVPASKYELKTSINTDGSDKIELKFLEDIEEAYILKYSSFINVPSGVTESISNEVTFAGQTDSQGQLKDKKTHNVQYRQYSGGRAFTLGTEKIKIKKEDADKENVPLEGAVFELRDESGTNILDILTTDENGEAKTKTSYKYQKYVIKEVEAPDGYFINPEYASGKVIIFDKDGDESYVFEVDQDGNKGSEPYTFKNQRGVWEYQLTKIDKANPSKVLAGAVFKLQKEVGGKYVDVDPGDNVMTTNASGNIHLKGLDKGVNYRLIETQAPVGYKLDQTPTDPFMIDDNQTSAKTGTMKNEIIQDGSVTLKKIDNVEGVSLEGAKFKLEYYNTDTKKWENVDNTIHITDSEGEIKIDQLKGGQYRFVEDAAPAEYLLDTTPREFSIIDGDKNVTVTFENKKIPGSLKVTKVDANDHNHMLEGAHFRILDADKKPVQVNGSDLTGITGPEGVYEFKDLRPGKYFLEETRAPGGYVIKDRLTEFEIFKDIVTEKTVENYRYTGGGGGDGDGGGGGGGTDPNPPGPNPNKPDPKDPDKEPTDKPDPEKPGKPEKPEKPTDPEKPKKPVEGKVEVPEGSTPKVGKEPEKGTVTVGEDGKWVYTPGDNFDGKDSFTIIVTDENGNEEEILVEIGGDVPTGGIKPEEQPGKVLPKTGEESHLPLQLLGVGLILLGAFLIVRKRFKRTT